MNRMSPLVIIEAIPLENVQSNFSVLDEAAVEIEFCSTLHDVLVFLSNGNGFPVFLDNFFHFPLNENEFTYEFVRIATISMLLLVQVSFFFHQINFCPSTFFSIR